MAVLPSHNKRELPKQLHCVVMIYSQVLNIINIENVFEPNAFMHSAPSTAIWYISNSYILKLSNDWAKSMSAH